MGSLAVGDPGLQTHELFEGQVVQANVQLQRTRHGEIGGGGLEAQAFDQAHDGAHVFVREGHLNAFGANALNNLAVGQGVRGPSRYASMSPPTPSLVPPKYRATANSTLVKSLARMTPKMGGPALLLGSPSSLHRCCVPSYPSIQAYATCRAA